MATAAARTRGVRLASHAESGHCIVDSAIAGHHIQLVLVIAVLLVLALLWAELRLVLVVGLLFADQGVVQKAAVLWLL
jgi:hypothetical protein